MSEPVRLLDMDGDPMGASLLRAGLDDGPPPGAKDEVYRSIQAALGVAVVGAVAATASQASAAASTTTAASTTVAGATTAAGTATAVKMGAAQALVVKLGIAKAIGVVGLCSAAVVGAGFGVREIVRDRAPAQESPVTVAATTDVQIAEAPRGVSPNRTRVTPRVVATDEPATAPSATTTSEPALDPSTDKPAPSVKPTVSAPAASISVAASASAVALATPSKPELASEPAGVAEVRSKLRAGDASGALALLSAIQDQFGAGRMSEDRAVLTIEALAASGNTAAARANADAFLKAHPTSPFASRVRTYATP